MQKKFTSHLLDWYKNNPRNLPWKNTKNPYFIWLSEIILQQTRVEYGINYYLKFTELFPTVQDLAAADQQEVIKAWEGLGYYSRARNLHATAKHIVEELNGNFPKTYRKLIKLKGIGPYTAAAIASFAFGEKKAAIDGNAYRVFARYFDVKTPIDKAKGKKEFQELGDKLIKRVNSADFNQAVMNFGSMVCTPKQAKCNECPLVTDCRAFAEDKVFDYPVKIGKNKNRNRYFTSFILQFENHIYIKERVTKDVWQNLYEFPSIELKQADYEQGLTQFLEQISLNDFYIEKVIENQQQQLSHQRIHIDFVFVKLKQKLNIKNTIYLPKKELNQYPFPKIYQNILKILLS